MIAFGADDRRTIDHGDKSGCTDRPVDHKQKLCSCQGRQVDTVQRVKGDSEDSQVETHPFAMMDWSY